jgi:hypothetical protein
MSFFVKAVITGFALSLGAAVFRKVAPHLGLDEKDKEDKSDTVNRQDAATDPGLQ